MGKVLRFVCRDCGTPCSLEFEIGVAGLDCRPSKCVLSYDEANWEEES